MATEFDAAKAIKKTKQAHLDWLRELEAKTKTAERAFRSAPGYRADLEYAWNYLRNQYVEALTAAAAK